MDLLLNDQQMLLRDAAAKLGASKGGPRRARKLRDAKVEIDAEAWAEILEAGWLSALVSEKNDGLGLGIFDLALALEEAGKQVLMSPLVEAASAIWALTEAAGRPPSSQTKLVVPATNLPGQGYAGTSHGGLLRFDSQTSTLSGSVPFVPFAAAADVLLVNSDADKATVLCLVPRDTAGLSIATSSHVDGSTSSVMSFAHVAVSGDQMIGHGEEVAAVVRKMQELLVLGTSAELLGVAKAALDMTLEYIKFREQFGKPIGSFQALQHRVVNCYVDVELNRSLLFNVLAAWDAGTCHPAMISAVKARVGRGALNTVRTALQLHGAIGYTDEHDIGIFYKRAVSLAAKYGNEITHVGRFSDLTLSSN